MAPVAELIQQQPRRTVVVRHNDVDVAIVIEIPESRRPADFAHSMAGRGYSGGFESALEVLQ